MFKITKVDDEKSTSINPEQMKLKRNLTENNINKENSFNKFIMKINLDKKNTLSMEADSMEFLNLDKNSNKENINSINSVNVKVCKTQIILKDNSKFASISANVSST